MGTLEVNARGGRNVSRGHAMMHPSENRTEKSPALIKNKGGGV